MNWSQRLGTVGVWRSVGALDPALAGAVEDLGYGTLWLGGSPGSHLREAEDLLGATASLRIATGIVNIWKSDPAELADSYHRIEAKHPGRLLLGIGSGHREARAFLDRYLALSNYTTTMRRGGFSAADVAGGGSDHLVDRIVAHGDAPVLAAAVLAHLDAGADHVCVQVQPAGGDIVPALRAIATELGLGA